VKEVVSILQDGTRFLTLTGPGGSGKTRLAIEAAAELLPDFRNGVFWVGLSPLRDPSLVHETIGQTLGAKDGLVDHIGDRDVLLLLDNLEQVIEVAPELASLVEACPNLRLLVTSRELLRVRGEVEYPVPPLADPDAVDLFCARSGLYPDATIAELCRSLDSLPLAVELAAARTAVLSPRQILDRLSGRLDLFKGGRDADHRQATLRATIEWSHDLLSDDEKTLFARLSVFRRGCNLQAAQQVGEAGLDLLQSIVDKSLVRHAGDRFWMLETIREYASERLETSGEAHEVGRSHAEHFLALAEEAEPRLLGPGAVEWHDLLEEEHDNLRAALDHFESVGDTERALRLAGSLAEFWDQRAHSLEGRRRFERLLAADDRPSIPRAKALDGASMMASKLGDLAASKRWGEEALDLHRALGNPHGIGIALWQLGYLYMEEGDYGTAERLLDEAVDQLRDVGDEASLVWAIRTLAFIHYNGGDLGRARELYEENLHRAEAVNDMQLQAASLGALSRIALDQGRLDDAMSITERSLRTLLDVTDVPLKVSVLCIAARIMASFGRDALAARLIGHADAVHEETGVEEPWLSKMNEETRQRLRQALDERSFAEARDQGRELSTDQAVSLALESLN
jgi:predicted ATPase